MSVAMPDSGDITDQFDDDALRRSIESAEKSGTWRDPTANFDDPKLKELARQLAEAPRASYAERRLQELDRRAAEKAKAATRPTEARSTPTFTEPPAKFTDPATNAGPGTADSWRQTLMQAPEAPPAPPPELELEPAAEPEMDGPLARLQAAANSRALITSLASAALVFGLGLLVQVGISGWTPHLGVRVALAAGAAGVAWHWFGVGRFRAAVIGAAAHMAAFGSASGEATGEQMFATFLASMVVLFGPGAVGLMREANYSSHRAPRR